MVLLLHPISTWRKAVLALVGGNQLPTDPRYINHPAHELVMETDEAHYTIDGEVFTSLGRTFEVRLGPQLQIATAQRRAVTTGSRLQARLGLDRS